MATTSTQIPGYIAGTYTIDPIHTDVSFMVRHMMVSKVRGKFHGVQGTIILAEDPAQSRAEAEIDLRTIDTGNPDRDAHIRSADFFDVDSHPAMTFRSTSVQLSGRTEALLTGELTLHGVTRTVELEVEVNGFAKDPYGATRCGFSAETEISRSEFGIKIDMPMDGGGAVVGDKIRVQLEIEAILAEPPL
jgi:polyisoprenoid-binding protein YceI